jgi:hypothetical protein
LIGFIALIGCSKKNIETDKYNCTYKEGAVLIANTFMENNNYQIDEYEIIVQDTDDNYVITYSLNDPFLLGGGGEIHIRKVDCEITSAILFQ